MRLAALILSVLFVTSVAAQGEKTRAATEADFTGYWRIVLIPNEVHKSRFKNEDMGFSDPCQIFVHKPDGTWYNISITNMAGAEESRRRCPTQKARIDVTMFAQSQSPFRWSKLPNQDGFFFIRDVSVTNPQGKAARLWKVDYVLEDLAATPTLDFEFKKGDVIMQLTQRLGGNNIAPVWPMVLRPLAE